MGIVNQYKLSGERTTFLLFSQVFASSNCRSRQIAAVVKLPHSSNCFSPTWISPDANHIHLWWILYPEFVENTSFITT
jgi:hypothetical protein